MAIFRKKLTYCIKSASISSPRPLLFKIDSSSERERKNIMGLYLDIDLFQILYENIGPRPSLQTEAKGHRQARYWTRVSFDISRMRHHIPSHALRHGCRRDIFSCGIRVDNTAFVYRTDCRSWAFSRDGREREMT